MNILTDKLPTFIEVDDVRIPINCDFRTSILFEQLMFDNDIRESKKVELAIALYFDNEIISAYFNKNNIKEIIEGMLNFYRCGKEETKRSDSSKSDEGYDEESERIYDFEYDSFYIYAAFIEKYNIDLQKNNLHWWQFKALFNALTDCKFMQIIEYRSVDLSSIKDAEQKKFYKKMKKLYKLPLSKSEQEKQDKINEMLMKGEDPFMLLQR